MPHLRSGAAGRSHLSQEAWGGDPEEPPQAQGQGSRWEELPTPEARGSVQGEGLPPGGRSNPRSGSCMGVGEPRGAEIPLVQGKKQQLSFAGAAVKRYPTPKVRETQVRW